MQQEATKKNKKLIWLIAGLAALLVVAGVVLTMFLLPGTKAPVETGPVGGRPDLYWNVDRLEFTAGGLGMSEREPGADGMYKIRFAYNGEIVEYSIADKRLVNAIDTMNVVGLVKDESGNVIDAVEPATIATEVARDVFVQQVMDGGLRLNSSVAMNGMETMAQFCELTQVYNVDETAEIPGQIDEAELMDRVLVYANDLGEITHVYLLDRQPKGEVYWRIDSKNVDSNGNTKRVPDENGIYYIMFAKDGKQVELKCKDKEIVNKIDSLSTRLSDIALQVDEEGFITGTLDSAIALRGKLLAAGYHVTAINGNEITCTYMFTGNDAGKSFTFTLNENTDIYNVCLSLPTEEIGKEDTLQLDDRIIVYTDLEGNPILIYNMMRRYTDATIVYNLTRQYDSTNLVTTRKTDGNGYYVFKVSIDGEQRTIRTKDKALATKLDSLSAQIAGVVLDGDIITFVCQDMYVAGHYKYVTSSYRLVTGITGVIVSFVTAGQDLDTAANLVMAPDVGIYDISGCPGTKMGEKTTLKEGDYVRLLADYQNNITHIYVLSTYSGLPVYYNLSRQYDSATSGTKRTPDEEGYYTFELASYGKQVTAKTKSKAIADFIDRQSPYMVALDIRDGIIRDAQPAVSSYEMGYKVCQWGYFQRFNGKKSMNCANSKNEGSTRYKIAENVKIYNVSGAYESYRGEPTTLQEGDRIACIGVGKTQEVVEIYVVARQIESKLYWNMNKQYSSATKETTREPDADGYYVFELAVDGTVKTFKTKDKGLATRLDSETYAVGLRLSGNTIQAVFSATNVKGVNSAEGAKYDVTKVSGSTVYIESLCPGNTSFGSKKTITKASGCKIYDVSAGSENPGAKTTLSVGDRVICYLNDADEAVAIFVLTKCVREGGAYGYCEHCDKEVYWQPFENKIYETDCHVYVTHDSNVTTLKDLNSAKNVEDRAELVLDLNGKTLGIRRTYIVYSTLTIIDSVGGGMIVTDVENVGPDKNGNGATLIVSKGGTINLCGGTITRNAQSDPAARGGCLTVGSSSNFVMYGGKITGGKATQGGNVFASNKATVVIVAGTIENGTADTQGGNISATSANIIIGKDAVISGGSVSTDKATGVGGNIYLGASSSNPDIYALLINGTVTGGTAFNSGNIDVATDKYAVLIDGGVVSKGTAEGYTGGNISTKGEIAISNGGKVIDGNAKNTNDASYGRGGNIFINGGALAVTKDSVISNGNGNVGGNIYVDKVDAVLLIDEGASVIGGTAATKGNSVYVNKPKAEDDTNLVMIAGSITANTLAEGAEPTGGDVVIEGKQTQVYLAGAAIIDNLTLPEGLLIDASELTDGAKIKVNANGWFTKEFETQEAADAAKLYFESLVEGKPVESKEKALAIGETTGAPVEPEEPQKPEKPKDPINDPLVFQEGTTEAYCAVCGENKTWTVAPTLTADITAADGDHYYVPAGQTVAPAEGGPKKLNITGGTVCIHLGTEAVEADEENGIEAAPASVFRVNLQVSGGATVNVMGRGELRRNDNDRVITVKGESTLNVYGGTIYGGTYSSAGGAIYAKGTSNTARSTILLTSEAVVSGGKSYNAFGGNIYAEWTNVTVSGYAEICNGQTTGKEKHGGNIYAKNADITVTGGSIMEGISSAGGGNIYMLGGKLNISGGVISGGEALDKDAGFGGNIYVDGTEVVITGGTVDAGQGYRGGNFMLRNGASLNISGVDADNKAIISDGYSMTHGGNIYVYGYKNEAGSTITVGEFAEFVGGIADNKNGHGGSIAVVGNASATSMQILTINGGEIKDGTAGSNGGNVSATTANAKVIMNGGVISGGTVNEEPFNMVIMNSATIDFMGGRVVGGRMSVVSDASVVRLGGNATVESGYIALSTGADMQILAGWTGSAPLWENVATVPAVGAAMPQVKAGNYVEGVFTAADVEYTGTLSYVLIEGNPAIVLATETAEAGDMYIAAPAATE